MSKEEEMAFLIFCMVRGYEGMRRDADSPIQRMIDEGKRLTEGFDEDELTDRSYRLRGNL